MPPAQIVSPDSFLKNRRTGGYLWTPERVKAAWYESLRLLQFWLNRPGYLGLTLMVGAPGAGKTYWLERNQRPDQIYFDATLTSRDDRARLVQMAAAAGVPTTAVILTTPLEVCQARNCARPASRRVPADQVLAKFERLAVNLPSADEGFTAIRFIPFDPAPEAGGTA